jgi:hypothetical protein
MGTSTSAGKRAEALLPHCLDEEGENKTFLDENPSFLRDVTRGVIEVRSIASKSSKSKQQQILANDVCILYGVIGSSFTYLNPHHVAGIIPPEDFKMFVDHFRQVLLQTAESPEWIETGVLKQHDFLCFDSATNMMLMWDHRRELLSTDNDDNMSAMGALAKLCSTSKVGGMANMDQSKDIVRLVAFLVRKGTKKTPPNPDEQYAILRHLDSCGLLQYILSAIAAVPENGKAEHEDHKKNSFVVLDCLQEEPRIVNKRLGDPKNDAGQVLTKIVAERCDGAFIDTDRPILAALKRLHEVARMSKPFMAKELVGQNEVSCFYYKCMKMTDKILVCGRCKFTRCKYALCVWMLLKLSIY